MSNLENQDLPVNRDTSTDYADSKESATALSVLVKNLILRKSSFGCFTKNQVYLDVPNIEEAVIKVCGELGLDLKDYPYRLKDLGFEIIISM